MLAARLIPVLPFAAAFASLCLAIARLLSKKPSPAGWWFVGGMLALGADSVLTGLGLHASRPEALVHWLRLAWVVKCVLPAIWLCFSLSYSRSDSRESIRRWTPAVVMVGLLPIVLSVVFWAQLVQLVPPEPPEVMLRLRTETGSRVINALLLIGLVLSLTNLEQTFRSAIGTMRWRIKFVILGLAVIFGTQIYVRSQAILFSAYPIALASLESGALLIGTLFLAVAYARTGFAEIDVYPSLAVLRTSFTVLIVGGYLFLIGGLAQLVKRYGGAEIFQLQAYVVILGMAGLAVLLLSDRARQRIRVFSARHFTRSQHDSVRIWSSFSRRLARVTDQVDLCAESARLISETFDVLSVTVWLRAETQGGLTVVASTARQTRELPGTESTNTVSSAVTAALQERFSPFDLDKVNGSWSEELRQRNPATFPNGGNRLCVPLGSGTERLGAIVLADRVSGAVYTVEELELLQCIGDQIASVLLNLRLTGEVAHARELEAFRTMSAFFVHDLKNAAASLNLMLKNLPVHFDNPGFRADTLRGIGNTAGRIEEMIARLSALRQRSQFAPVEADLNRLVCEALDRVDKMPGVELTKDLQPVPSILADREQLQSVVTNLVLNARDAVGQKGRIRVGTEHHAGQVILSVADDGCGMSPAFLRESLFRPFRSTKTKGLGIGLFQSRAIVQAHGGGMQVESEPGKGTTFLVSLPAKDQQ